MAESAPRPQGLRKLKEVVKNELVRRASIEAELKRESTRMGERVLSDKVLPVTLPVSGVSVSCVF